MRGTSRPVKGSIVNRLLKELGYDPNEVSGVHIGPDRLTVDYYPKKSMTPEGKTDMFVINWEA